MRHRCTRHARGFTLIELLVVIGIIAVLIAILLPVLSSMQARGRDLQCQSNIRQCVALVLTYAAENQGQLPYGYYCARGGGEPFGWGAPAGSGLDVPYVTMWSIISRMSSRSYEFEEYNFQLLEGRPNPNNSAPFLRCPEAMLVQPHRCSYVGSLLAFVSPTVALFGVGREGPPWHRLIERPTRLNQLVSSSALVWDTSVTPGMETRVGNVIGHDIDAQRLRLGTVHPQMRYYSGTHDPFARIPPGTYGYTKPVLLGISASTPFRNIDPPGRYWDGLGLPPYQGNLRFRHRKNTTCNVGFADGSIGQFTGKFKSDGSPISHNAIRKQFMVKWPSGTGIGPDPSLPH